MMSNPQRRYGEYDPALVDELAVDFVCNGTRMRLNRDERVVAVRRLAGQLSTSELADRIGTYDREVIRVLTDLGAIKCPACLQLTLRDDGVWRRHVDTIGLPWCPMSGQPYTEQTRPAASQGWRTAS